jgi:hypothetical protein
MKQDWTSFVKAGVPALGWPGFTVSDQRALSLVPPHPQLGNEIRGRAPLLVLEHLLN